MSLVDLNNVIAAPNLCELALNHCEHAPNDCEHAPNHCELALNDCEHTPNNCEHTLNNCELARNNCEHAPNDCELARNNCAMAFKAFNTVFGGIFFKMIARYINNQIYQVKFYTFIPVYRYIWLVSTLKNTLQNDELFYCSLRSPTLFLVEAFSNNDNYKSCIGKGGYTIPINERQTPDSKTVFSMLIEKGKTVSLLLHINNPYGTDGFFAPCLTTAAAYNSTIKNYNLIVGNITGIMLIALLMNIFFAISLKEKIHYLYALYVLCILTEFYTVEGLTDVYINYAVLPGVTDVIARSLPPLTFFLLTKIMQWFLNQTRSNSYFRLILDISCYVLLANSFIHVLNYFVHFDEVVMNFLQILLCIVLSLHLLLVFFSVIEKTVQKVKFAWVYLCAITLLLIGLFEFILLFLGVNSLVLVVNRQPNDFEIGLILEALIVFIAIIYRYNIYKTDKEKLLIERNTEQQTLINKIVDAEENERKRIAENLHDDVGSVLSLLSGNVKNAKLNINNPGMLSKYINQTLSLSQKAVTDVRNIAHDLLPRDFSIAGLFNVTRLRIAMLNDSGEICFKLVEDGNDETLPDVIAISVYRITNELLTNITKHSGASEAVVQLLISENEIQLMVEDNGAGFNQSETTHGIGLKNIKRRVEVLKGNICIESNHNGSETIIQIPLHHEQLSHTRS